MCGIRYPCCYSGSICYVIGGKCIATQLNGMFVVLEHISRAPLTVLQGEFISTSLCSGIGDLFVGWCVCVCLCVVQFPDHTSGFTPV